jgi:drug/metabolite transporter (DMT)-like permease
MEDILIFVIYLFFTNILHCLAIPFISFTFTPSCMNSKLINWGLFIVLSVIWGSSFILMKEGLKELSAYEVAAMRMFSAGIVLLPFALSAFKQIKLREVWLIIATGLLGSFIPAILFCVAETKIDSALAGMLNALTPLFVILVGVLFFQSATVAKKTLGVMIGFAGMIILFLGKGVAIKTEHLVFSSLILLATLCYGFNVNIIGRYLQHVSSIHIAAVAFVSLMIPSLLVLFANGFFLHSFSSNAVWWSVSASVILGILGTAVASILFYMLLKRAGSLFASTVTYGIPFIAVGWGLLAGETITMIQIGGLLVILAGVYIANK